ncbi:MAG: hypothetical protein M1837_003835 [Sclerophora amabilis]|nr:MAG: hypothetical protein M1837_003835 [Sclerophora amabilis]
MSRNYDPDPEAVPKAPWTIAALSQRDLAVQIPINYVTQPGVSITSACFAHRRYEARATQKCISNLLAAGYRRLVVDLYWDDDRRLWSFCPISVPTSSTRAGSTTVTKSLPPATSSGSSLTIRSDLAISADADTSAQMSQSSGLPSSPTPETTSSRSVTKRARKPDFSSRSATPSTTGKTLAIEQRAQSATSLDPSASSTAYQLGDYACSASANVSVLTSVLQDYINDSETTIDAQLVHIFFNIHAAALESSPSSPAASLINLPTPSNLLGAAFERSFSSFLYTPTILAQERRNLNASWYSVLQKYRPDPSYYTSNIDDRRFHSTTDGWPSEGYVETSRARRLLLSWGSIDPQMEGYNFSGDEGTVFQKDYLRRNADIKASDSGAVLTGCYFDPNETALSRINSSWASFNGVGDIGSASSPEESLNLSISLISNLTACGISPFLNQSLLSATASENIVPYANVSQSTIWSWAPGEPRNSSDDASDANTASPPNFRCAFMDLSLRGMWRVRDCAKGSHVACRAHNQPYAWAISPSEPSYHSAGNACPPGSSFSVPRTALENAYLYSALQGHNANGTRRDSVDGVWVDFNSIDLAACWVTGGPNAPCPYLGSAEAVQRRQVVIPTVAAVIVLVVTGLTILVKCNTNRRVSRRRKRRAEAGWDYEGYVDRTLPMCFPY